MFVGFDWVDILIGVWFFDVGDYLVCGLCWWVMVFFVFVVLCIVKICFIDVMSGFCVVNV